MTPSPQTVERDTPVVVAARTMTRLGIRHLPVIDANGRLDRILTDFHVFSRGGLVGAHDDLWIPFEEADAQLTCGELAVPAEIVASPGDPLMPLLRRLANTRQDVIVVVDGGRRPVGIVTEHDGVRLAAGALPPNRGAQGEGAIVALRRDAPAGRALELMDAHGVRHVLVTEADGRVFGVLSFADLCADGAAHRDLTADEVVRVGQLVAETGDLDLRRAAERMLQHRVGCVPFLDAGGRARAVITRTDVIRGLVAFLDGSTGPIG